METRTWTSFDGTTEEVEIYSNREKELKQKMNDVGLWEENNPIKPEGCLSGNELGSFIEQSRGDIINRMNDKLNNK